MKSTADKKLLKTIAAALESGDPIRLDLGRGERLHIDRPQPFLCVYVGRRREPAALGIVTANSAYLLVASLGRARAIIELVGKAMVDRFGAFLVIDVGELERDRLASDAAYLPPFETTASASNDAGAQAALAAFAGAVEAVKVKFRTPRVARPGLADDPAAKLARHLTQFGCLTVRFAPIYRVPESEAVYPELLERVVANFVDAGLHAVAAFAQETKSVAVLSHRAFGRKAFIDAVARADRAMDEVARSFDFLLAVTPINADAAWEEFAQSNHERAPRFLYRPLAFGSDGLKKKLFAIRLDQFEDPVLTTLYREKQQELDLMLSLIAARETPRFVELSRALYGPVEPGLLKAAKDVLAKTQKTKRRRGADGEAVDCAFVERRARAMVKAYAFNGEEAAAIEVRDDLPAGLMVSGSRLLISRSTTMPKGRVEALLSHEVGVHLLTYFNGSAQGLHLFRNGLAGYEGIQEGLAVFAEYLAGGMTVTRLRLLAARVIGCADMLDGASFAECFARMRELGLSPALAFNLVLRLYRGGGLAKDAIYLRGLIEILSHLRAGGALDPFFMGKIAASHFSIMQELSTRGLIKPPRFAPQFLSHPEAEKRLAAATNGMSPIDMIRP
ncbi:flavohemoglobin expression-modulating QEGLA motif protein [Devosia nitrariae]|uniref:Flavohemoglobin expression-modulating QEGLA motif protein n=1 Tax=Devosia nitrariae TaxID=2071872 RepID=A0ABQ5W1T3_9HYPH|nr:flavohemoglobin expression-modulating QEGLA motif protein [Devosia nitrariae]GLQ54032.1 hypothetical protein GCM10010862_12910 [Devosia nitrariae]